MQPEGDERTAAQGIPLPGHRSSGKDQEKEKEKHVNSQQQADTAGWEKVRYHNNSSNPEQRAQRHSSNEIESVANRTSVQPSEPSADGNVGEICRNSRMPTSERATTGKIANMAACTHSTASSDGNQWVKHMGIQYSNKRGESRASARSSCMGRGDPTDCHFSEEFVSRAGIRSPSMGAARARAAAAAEVAAAELSVEIPQSKELAQKNPGHSSIPNTSGQRKRAQIFEANRGNAAKSPQRKMTRFPWHNQYPARVVSPKASVSINPMKTASPPHMPDHVGPSHDRTSSSPPQIRTAGPPQMVMGSDDYDVVKRPATRVRSRKAGVFEGPDWLMHWIDRGLTVINPPEDVPVVSVCFHPPFLYLPSPCLCAPALTTCILSVPRQVSRYFRKPL